MAARSLKASNAGWIWALVALDAVISVLIADPRVLANLKANEFLWLRGIVVAAAPVVVLLVSSLLPSSAKDVLVFWRRKEVLPGHRAFSVHAPRDPRIDMQALKKNVGAWPDDASGQNSMWFKLYKKVEADVAVAYAHKSFLLFRDLAAISVLLAPVAFTAVLLSEGTSVQQAALATSVFATQYVLCLIAARNSAYRFVCNVLCAHAVKRRTA